MEFRVAVPAVSSSDARFPTTLVDAGRQLLELDTEAVWQPFIAECLLQFSGEELLVWLKAEAERVQASAPNKALRLSEALIYGAGLAARPEHVALGLMAKGDALRYHGEYERSLSYFDDAGQRFLASGNEAGWARTRIGWIVSLHRLGRAAEALTVVERAYQALANDGQFLRAAALDLNTAVISAHLGHYAEALRRYDRALATYQATEQNTDVRQAKVMAQKATLLTLLGEFPAALALHGEAQAIFTRHGESVFVQQEQQNIAYVYAAQGRYTQALHLYGGAMTAFEQAGLPVDAAWVALDMVECYLSLNRSQEAVQLAEETVDRFLRLGTPTEAAKARFQAALGRARLGDITGALDRLDQAAQTFSEAGLTADLGLVTLQRAALHLEVGQVAAAHVEAGQARALFADLGLVVRQAQAGLVQARAALALGRHDEATALARAALVITQERDVPWLDHQGHHVLAGVAQARRDVPGALLAYAKAVTSIERVQSSLTTELRTNFLLDKLEVYEETIDCCLRTGDPLLAWSYLERAKSRTLVDYLAATRDVRPKAQSAAGQVLAADLARLRTEHHWFYQRLYGHRIAQQPNGPLDAGEEAMLRTAIQDRERRISRLLERLALEQSDGLSISAQSPPVLPPLDPGTVLLEYYFPRVGGMAFVVTPEGLNVVPLPMDSRTLRGLIDRWQLNVRMAARAVAEKTALHGLGRNAQGLLAALHAALIAPAAAHLEGCERLVVVPYGPTHTVPFHALYDGRRHLLESLEVSTCPSVSLFQLCGERPRAGGRSALVVGHSDGGRLPSVLREARAVAALLPGECYLEEQATCAAVMAAAPRHGVLHLAAHGEARLDNPTFAHLTLADGQLGMADVFNLTLDGALVTLSACETGRGVVEGGDEVIGLSRGFLHAGAATVVQSLWPVEDGSTAMLMERFYGALGQGRTKSAALREAQLAMLAEHGAHPYFWAPFQLVGATGPL